MRQRHDARPVLAPGLNDAGDCAAGIGQVVSLRVLAYDQREPEISEMPQESVTPCGRALGSRRKISCPAGPRETQTHRQNGYASRVIEGL